VTDPATEDASRLAGLLNRFAAVSPSLLVVTTDAAADITHANPAFAASVGLSSGELVGRSLGDFVDPAGLRRLREAANATSTGGTILFSLTDVEGHPFSAEGVVDLKEDALLIAAARPEAETRTLSVHLQHLNNELATLVREHARQEREYRDTALRLQSTLDELDRSYWHLRKIQEFVPICMRCSRVKTDGSEWQSVADYLRKNQVFMSHGYCPACADLVLEDHERP